MSLYLQLRTLLTIKYCIDTAKGVNYSTTSSRKNTCLRRLLPLSWSNFSKPLNIFIPSTSRIGISNQRILCSIVKMIFNVSKWLILVCPRTFQKTKQCIPWVDLLTILLLMYSCRNTIPRLIFGQWVLFSISCSQERCHSLVEANKKSLKTW